MIYTALLNLIPKMKPQPASFGLLPILVCTLLMRLSAVDIPGNETDRISLLAFKSQITHTSLPVLSSWNNSIHFCNWEGVTCSNQHQRVTELNLESQGLIGNLSPYIGNLSLLRSINLQNNSLQGRLPEDVGRLYRLEEFIMSNNSFSDQIPANLSHCSNLTILDLNYNNLVGKIPPELGSLSKLVRLRFYANNLTGQIPDSLGNLSYLELLVLGTNSLDGSIPRSLGQLTRLTFLGLGLNMLSGTVPPLLYNISSLLRIGLPINQLEDTLPRDVGPNLRWFLIGGNKFSGTIPISFITNASGLQILDLSFNNFNGKVPVEVGMLKNLTSLQVDANNLGNGATDDLDFITSLNNCSSLQALSMGLNKFGGILPRSIANLSKTVDQLYLGGNQILGTIPSDIGNLNNLMTLALQVNLISGTIPESIGNLQKLQVLSLWGNRLSGQILNSIGNMTQLYYLDLSDNKLQGNISVLENCRILQIFNLSYNELNGTIPREILLGLSSRLTSIILAHNSLVGTLPSEIGSLKNLQRLDISYNKISGDIPYELGGCLSLEYLYLGGNYFQGTIPPSFSSLRVLQYLDLSRNNLSGKVLKGLGDLSFLNSLNLAFNDFEGEVPIQGIFQNASAFSVVGNDKLCGGLPDLDLPKCHIEKSKKPEISLALKLTLGLVIPLFLIVSLLFVLYLTRKGRLQTSSQEFLGFSSRLLGNRLKTVSYNDLWRATNGFSVENLIGTGSCGSVYKGILPADEQTIAVKVLNLIERGASKSFMAECEVLRKVRHRNLLKIITVCSSVDSKGNDFKALVFEFMPNGSVENWLHSSSERKILMGNLNLIQRLDIAIDVATALDYLHNHCETPIVHCDLKPSNILLDEDMVAYVADFGLAKFLPKTTNSLYRHEMNSVALRGTIGYIPPEYGTGGEISTLGDVYSYGVFLLEMFTGKRPTDEMFKDGLNLHNFSKLALQGKVMDIIDVSLLSDGDEGYIGSGENIYEMDQMHKCFVSIMKTGLACSSGPVAERMDINDVLMEMHGIKEAYCGIGIHSEKLDFVH